MNRQELLAKTISSLKENNFYVSTFLVTNACFDIIAKSPSKKIIIKVYDNIDSVRKEQGEELRKLSKVLDATPIIIGAKTKVFSLKDGTIYYRYDVPTITLKTFEGILESESPKMRYFKGKYTVDLDADILRKKREELALSVEELAEKIGVVSDTLQRFERGSRIAHTSLETAQKLEEELDESLVKKIDVFEEHQKEGFDDVPEGKILEKFRDLGLKMAIFKHSPFRAYGDLDSGMLISMGKGNADMPRKAVELNKISSVIKSDSVIVTKEYKMKSIQGIPVIEEADLDTIRKINELKKLIQEKEECK